VNNISKSVRWYEKNLLASTLYCDKTWALLQVKDTKIALTISSQHPPHTAFRVNSIDDFPSGCIPAQHRDGSWYYYQRDLDGNVIEWIFYPQENE
tara:strand:- start:2835 stop:3119 length:285 start_codon:yes stop_codon:yes gene_type:complete